MQLSRIADDMSGREVVSAGRIPRYLRLSNAILNLFEAGEMHPGDRRPPEGAPAGAIPASLGTVQRAIGHLRDSGVVARKICRGQPASYQRVWLPMGHRTVSTTTRHQ